MFFNIVVIIRLEDIMLYALQNLGIEFKYLKFKIIKPYAFTLILGKKTGT